MRARAALILGLLLLGACKAVQPWERGTLARPEMQWEGDAMEARLRDQIHFSKEASSGGNGASGGGCGCN